jgi:zona occludens toxin (predicted ATPase)
MKVAEAIIQNRNISINTETDFEATYKGKRISISTNHGFGKPKYDHLKRYIIDVKDIETGLLDVDAYQDFHTMKDAIMYALKGACLIWSEPF